MYVVSFEVYESSERYAVILSLEVSGILLVGSRIKPALPHAQWLPFASPMTLILILSAFSGSQLLLTRSVLYTAITRARELFIIVGNEEVIAAMTRNDRQQRRYSGLKLRLEQGEAE